MFLAQNNKHLGSQIGKKERKEKARQDGPLLHLADGLLVEQAARLGGQRHIDHHLRSKSLSVKTTIVPLQEKVGDLLTVSGMNRPGVLRSAAHRPPPADNSGKMRVWFLFQNVIQHEIKK